MCVIVAFVPYYAQMQTLWKIDIAENVEEIKLICILASINNCPIYNQPEFCHHEASSLATISVFPLGMNFKTTKNLLDVGFTGCFVRLFFHLRGCF